MRLSLLNRDFQPINFKRAILPEEEKDYHQSIEDGKKYLGINNLALIIHGSSFHVAGHDLYIGFPYNNKANEINKYIEKMPELLKRTVISKTLNKSRSLDSVKTLVDSLDHWEKVLYEPTNN